MTDYKTALILEGGGSKGAFEAGIIKFIYDNKLKIDFVGGTSVGGLNAACFAFNKVPDLLDIWGSIKNETVYTPANIINIIDSFFSEGKLRFDMRKLFQSGNGKMLKEICENLVKKHSFLDNRPLKDVCVKLFEDKKISQSDITLFLTAVELQSGNLTYFGEDKNGKDIDCAVVDALMATSAIQGVFPPHTINGKQYIDGGNGANLPLKYAIRHQCNRIILARDNIANQQSEGVITNPIVISFLPYLTAINNFTIQDIKWAGEINERIDAEEEIRKTLLKFTDEIQNEGAKKKYAKLINDLPRVFKNKRHIEIIEIVPSWMPLNIIDFDLKTSQKLIIDGNKKAEEKLNKIL